MQLNADLGQDEQRRRLDIWRGYHDAVDRVVGESDSDVVLSIHTFTPVFEGQRRAIEVGVLFDHDVDLAERVGAAISETGFRVGMNEPYSGRRGMMYSAERHAHAAGKRALELELRQDLAVEETARARLVRALHGALTGAESPT